MGFFEDAKKKLDDANQWVDERGGVENLMEEASKRADEVLEAAANMGGSIPGDVNDTLISKAKEIKAKLDGLQK